MSQQYFTLTIPAAIGGTPGAFNYPVPGTVFRCIVAGGDFRVQPDNQVSMTMNSGRGFGAEGAEQFNRLTFFNDSAVAIQITFYAGFQSFQSDQTVASVNASVSSKDPSTYTKGTGILALDAGASDTYNGLDGAKTRKQIIVTNRDAAADLELQDNGANIGCNVKAGEKVTLVTNGVIKVKNTTGAPINYSVLETFYS